MLKRVMVFALSMAIVFPPVQASSTPASAATCSVAGGQSGRLKYSGQLGVGSATVCGNQLWKLVGKPSKPVKPIKRTKPYKPIKLDHQFTVNPDRPTVSVDSTKVSVGQLVSLVGHSVRHTRNRMLLWYPAQVRFLPKQFDWTFADGSRASGLLQNHSWVRSGTYAVKLVVGFAVKYRIIGKSTWVSLPGLVYSSSVPQNITVAVLPQSASSKVVLVHWNCLEKQKVIGC